jgi:hypothetical protein
MSRRSATQLSDYVKTLLNIETIVYIEKPLLTAKGVNDSRERHDAHG